MKFKFLITVFIMSMFAFSSLNRCTFLNLEAVVFLMVVCILEQYAYYIMCYNMEHVVIFHFCSSLCSGSSATWL